MAQPDPFSMAQPDPFSMTQPDPFSMIHHLIRPVDIPFVMVTDWGY